MATLELDPVFLKALRLLHSKAKDSAAQLRSMVEDSIASRKIKVSDGDLKSLSRVSSSKDEEVKKKESERRKYEKLKAEINELECLPSEPKKPKQEASPYQKEEKSKDRDKEKERQRKEKERREQEKERERQQEKERERQQEKEREKELEREREKERARLKEKEESSESEESSEDEEEEGGEEEEEEEEEDNNQAEEMSMDADDFAVGLGIACTVCRGFDVTSKNQIMECQECKNLYHQECHKPPFTDVFDPRSVWYCSKCQKHMKKQAEAAKKLPKSKPSSSSLSSSKETVVIKDSKAEMLIAFKRTEVKALPSNSKETPNTPTQSLLGLQALKVGLTKPPKSSDPAKQQPGWKDLSRKDSVESSRTRLPDGKDKPAKDSNKDKAGSPTSSSSSGSSSSSSSSGKPVSAAAPGSAGNGGSGKSGLSSSSMANANKRLQIMKKNAAKLQKERSVHIK